MIRKLFDKVLNPQNTFFTQANTAKRLPHIALSSLLLPLMFIAGGAVITNFAILPLITSVAGDLTGYSELLFYLIFLYTIVVFLIFIWVKFFEKRPFITVGLQGYHKLKKYLLGFGTGFLMMSIIVGLMWLSGNIEIKLQSFDSIPLISVLAFLIGYILQGGSEEILARGWQFQVISVRNTPWLGALITSIVFALLHGFNNSVTVLAIFNLFLFAILLVLFVMNDTSIWRACGWHSAWNWTMGNVYGLEVSGSSTNPSLIHSTQVGNNILNGGGFGPEGSLYATIILALGILVMLFIIYKKD